MQRYLRYEPSTTKPLHANPSTQTHGGIPARRIPERSGFFHNILHATKTMKRTHTSLLNDCFITTPSSHASGNREMKHRHQHIPTVNTIVLARSAWRTPTQHNNSKDADNRKNACVMCKNLYGVRDRTIVQKGKLVYVYSLVSLFVMYVCDGVAYITTMSLDFWNFWSKIIFPEISLLGEAGVMYAISTCYLWPWTSRNVLMKSPWRN